MVEVDRSRIQSLLVTCRLHAVDPYTYLVDVLQRISAHPAKRAIELTPRMWKSLFADVPMRSDLGPTTTTRHHTEPDPTTTAQNARLPPPETPSSRIASICSRSSGTLLTATSQTIS